MMIPSGTLDQKNGILTTEKSHCSVVRVARLPSARHVNLAAGAYEGVVHARSAGGRVLDARPHLNKNTNFDNFFN